ncbi:MAG: hypothetical protein LBK99_07975, partial [Opitutaceae bacterium]|nr:hypothetical protein [Opitutaceae bacterium]
GVWRKKPVPLDPAASPSAGETPAPLRTGFASEAPTSRPLAFGCGLRAAGCGLRAAGCGYYTNPNLRVVKHFYTFFYVFSAHFRPFFLRTLGPPGGGWRCRVMRGGGGHVAGPE